MVESILTEQEELILEQIKSQFYYPSQLSIDQAIASVSQNLDEETRLDIIEIALQQVGYEQTMRRQYVLSSLYANADLLNRIAQENLVLKVAELTPGSAPPTATAADNPIAVQIIANVTTEIIQQAQIFKVVELQLNSYNTLNRLTPQVQSLYNSLKKIPVENLEKLRVSIQTLIADLAKQDERIFDLNPEIPASIVLELKKAGLELSIGRYKTLGEKLNFLGVTLLISSVITQSVANSLNLSAEEELLSTGRLMAAQNIRLVDPGQ